MTQEMLRTIVAAGIGALVILAGVAVFDGRVATAPADELAGVAIQCEPSQRAVVHRAPNGDGSAVVECVTAGASAAAAPVAMRPAYRAPAVETRLMQAAYAPAADLSQPVAIAPAPVVRTQTTARRDDGRSWKDRALVIGGAAGAGAGVGGLAGGKKGALIGAAIGGGGAALFEAIRGSKKN